MDGFERVADVQELQPGGRLSVFVDDVPVLLLQTEAGYRAIEDVCTHDGQPLTDGPVSSGTITCQRHGAKFDLATGKPVCMPATKAVVVYEVKIEAGSILLRAAEPGTMVAAVPARSSGSASAAASVSSSPAAPAVSASSAVLETVPSCDHTHEGACSSSTSGTQTAGCAASESGGEEDADKSLDQKMIEALRDVIDPELMINIVDLGLIYAINYDGRKAFIDMTLTSPACPAGPQIVQQSKMALERLRDVDEAVIKLVMTPPWTPDRMTEEARDMLGIF